MNQCNRRGFLKGSLTAIGTLGTMAAAAVWRGQGPTATEQQTGGKERLTMRLGLGQFNEITDERLAFIKQCGVEDFLLNTPTLPGEHRWELQDLTRLRQRADAAGLRLFAIENVPTKFYDKIMLGLPGRDEQIEHMKATVRNLGRAGITTFGYHFMPNSVWRTSRPTIRGGAVTTAFDLREAAKRPLSAGRVYTEAEMWRNYDWYLERILPVCKESGVRLALHPDDPPVETLGGIPRLFRNFENFRRAMKTHDSPMHGLDFCHGCWSEMRGGAGILEAIDYFGSRGKILYVHMRDVIGAADKFVECWLGDGNSNILAVMRKLKAVRFDGIMITDHVPRMADDTPWCHRGRAYTIGYMRALLDVINA